MPYFDDAEKSLIIIHIICSFLPSVNLVIVLLLGFLLLNSTATVSLCRFEIASGVHHSYIEVVGNQ